MNLPNRELGFLGMEKKIRGRTRKSEMKKACQKERSSKGVPPIVVLDGLSIAERLEYGVRLENLMLQP